MLDVLPLFMAFVTFALGLASLEDRNRARGLARAVVFFTLTVVLL